MTIGIMSFVSEFADLGDSGDEGMECPYGYYLPCRLKKNDTTRRSFLPKGS
jgi:hypothetical protein